MTKSATDVMQDIVFAAVIDSIMALRASSNGLPNLLLRDLSAIHANTTLADLPKEMQTAIAGSVRAAFTRLLKEGYSVSAGQSGPARAPQSPPPGAGRDGPGQFARHRRPAPKPGGTDPGKPPRGGPRPNRGPRPGGG